METIIREVEPADYPAVASLWNRELNNSKITVEVLAETYAKMKKKGDYATYVAVRGGETVGMITTVEVMAVGFPVGYIKINGLAVKTENQGMGIGRALIEHVERIAKERGISSLGLATGFQRTGAHAFYERMGFKSGSYWYGKNVK